MRIQELWHVHFGHVDWVPGTNTGTEASWASTDFPTLDLDIPGIWLTSCPWATVVTIALISPSLFPKPDKSVPIVSVKKH